MDDDDGIWVVAEDRRRGRLVWDGMVEGLGGGCGGITDWDEEVEAFGGGRRGKTD